MSTPLLIIDDDESLSAMLAEYLQPMDFQVTGAATVAAGLEALRSGQFEVLVLDVMLPDGDGFEVCRTVRAESAIPILMLTARGDETHRIVGLELGADDYLPKPFNLRELMARLRAIVRRGAQPAGVSEVLRFGRLSIGVQQRLVCLEDQPCNLTGHQFDLLHALASNAGRVMSRDALLNHLRGHQLEAFDRSIDVHISRIRAAIEDDPKHPRRVFTLRGAGYLFTRNPDARG